MDLFLGQGTSQGQRYLPDEMAQALADEKKLKKGDCISKGEIIAFLAKQGVSNLLATDVAMVLRNVYGVTPTFDEAKKMNLIGELNRVLTEDYENPTQAYAPIKKAARELTMAEMAAICSEALQTAFNENKSQLDDLVVAHMATLPLAQVEAIASLGEVLSESDYQQIEACWERGGMQLAESWFDMAARPHTYRFLEERVQHDLMEVGASPGYFSSTAHMQRRAAPQGGGDRIAQAKRDRRAANRAQGGEDPLANRQPGHIKDLGGGQDHVGDLRRDVSDPSVHRIERERMGRRDKARRGAVQQATAQSVQRQKEGPSNLPADIKPKGPGLGARLKTAGRAALGAMGNVAARAFSGKGDGSHSPAPAMGQPAASANPSEAPQEKKPSMLKRIIRGAGRVVKHVAAGAGKLAAKAAVGAGKMAGAAAKNLGAASLHHIRNKLPVLGYAFGTPGEREQKYADMLHTRDTRKAELAGLRGQGQTTRRELPQNGSQQQGRPQGNRPRTGNWPQR